MPAYLQLWDTAEQDETNWNNLEILVASGCFVSWVPEWVLFARSSFDDFPLTGCARWFAAGGCHLVNNEDSTSLSLGGTIVGDASIVGSSHEIHEYYRIQTALWIQIWLLNFFLAKRKSVAAPWLLCVEALRNPPSRCCIMSYYYRYNVLLVWLKADEQNWLGGQLDCHVGGI
jgi:hypothetical protein